MTGKKRIKTKTSPYDDENVLSIYMKEINRIPLLTREEEDRYARRAAAGDPAAREKLVRANLRFVVNVAKKYQNQGLPLSDLINEGNIGLMNAIERYDVDKGYHFISYAVWWIRQAVLKAICEKSRMIRLPLNRANELVQIKKAEKSLQGEKGDDYEIKDIAAATNLKDDHVMNLLSISKDIVSLETPVYMEKGASELGDFIQDDEYQAPDEQAIENSLRNDINAVLDTLSERESQIIQYRYGLNGHSSMSLKDIGDRYNLTKERIRQIEKKALKRLQHPSRSQYLEAYIA